MSSIGATGLNAFDEEIENTSNYVTQISLDSSNYTSNVNFNSSNYTDRMNEDLSDRIEFPASLILFVLSSGVYIPIKAQELEIGQVSQLVGVHTGAIYACIYMYIYIHKYTYIYIHIYIYVKRDVCIGKITIQLPSHLQGEVGTSKEICICLKKELYVFMKGEV